MEIVLIVRKKEVIVVIVIACESLNVIHSVKYNKIVTNGNSTYTRKERSNCSNTNIMQKSERSSLFRIQQNNNNNRNSAYSKKGRSNCSNSKQW